MRASKDQQADPMSVHRLQSNEKPRDKMHIHLGCSTTHGRAKFVPSDFHLFGFFEDENGQEIFLRFHPDIKKS